MDFILKDWEIKSDCKTDTLNVSLYGNGELGFEFKSDSETLNKLIQDIVGVTYNMRFYNHMKEAYDINPSDLVTLRVMIENKD